MARGGGAMTDVVLINPFDDYAGASDRDREGCCWPWRSAVFATTECRGAEAPHLGLLQIAAVLESAGLSCQVLDSVLRFGTLERIARRVEETKPRIIGISSTTPTFQTAVE